MLFVGARRILNVAEPEVATRLHLGSSVVKYKQHCDSLDLKHNYKQMFLDNQCQLQSWGTVKVPIHTGHSSFFAFIFTVLCYSSEHHWFNMQHISL
jgi:hypothetical protein